MLTPAQKATLKAFILADPVLSAFPNNYDGDIDMAAQLNKVATPDFFVWKTSVPPDEIMSNGFDWTRVDNLTVGKARIWDWLTRLPLINPSRPNVRSAVESTFTAEVADEPNRVAVYSHFQRLAKVVEKVLAASGSGVTSSTHGVGPATMGFEAPISPEDVRAARDYTP